jgi:hypothetical protein
MNLNFVKNYTVLLLILLRYRYCPVTKKSRTLAMVTKNSPMLLIIHQRYLPLPHRYLSVTDYVTVICFYRFLNLNLLLFKVIQAIISVFFLFKTMIK